MFYINDLVKINSNNLTGKIIRVSRNKYTILLNNNSKVTLSENDIQLLNKNGENSNNIIPKVNISYNINNSNFDNELMIRHQTVLEALENVDMFISASIAHKEKRVKIIHGRHGGILRNAVHEYLKSSPFVEKYHIADECEGSIGATIVYLK